MMQNGSLWCHPVFCVSLPAAAVSAAAQQPMAAVLGDIVERIPDMTAVLEQPLPSTSSRAAFPVATHRKASKVRKQNKACILLH